MVRLVGFVMLFCIVLPILVGCISETQKLETALAEPGQPKSTAAPQGKTIGSGTIVTAVLLDPAAYLPSVYSKEGTDEVLRALASKGHVVSEVSGWDELRASATTGHMFDLVVIVSFRDVPNMDTYEQPERKCTCAFSGSVVEVSTGRVIHRQQTEHEGAPGSDFKKACLEAVLAAARDYSDIAAPVIDDYKLKRLGGKK